MKTFKKLLAALFCIALLGPVMTSCSKNDVRDILLTSDKSWEDIVKERPFMANFPKYGGNIQTLVMGSANSTSVGFTDNATQETALGYYSQFEAAGFTKEMKKEGEITTYTFTKVISGKTYQFIGNWQENKNTRGTFTLMFSEL